MARTVHAETGYRNLCMAGGVALNCVGNGRVLRDGPFERIWIQPAAGDAGGAIGAALSVWYRYNENDRVVDPGGTKDGMSATLLGPEYGDAEVAEYIKQTAAVGEPFSDQDLPLRVAHVLSEGKVVGWFHGRMEFGPRALGARSILGDPRSSQMQAQMNLKIKFRESFRPFAPSILREHVSEFFELDADSPYMLQVAQVKAGLQLVMSETEKSLFGIDKLNVPRSSIPAVTHVDYSARIQTVSREDNPMYYDLIKAFHSLTGCPLVVNTSFNVRGEPIVNTLDDAYRCFMRTEMDCLVLGNYVLFKQDQPNWEEEGKWQEQFALD
jgi:carbamoyltransferase